MHMAVEDACSPFACLRLFWVVRPYGALRTCIAECAGVDEPRQSRQRIGPSQSVQSLAATCLTRQRWQLTASVHPAALWGLTRQPRFFHSAGPLCDDTQSVH